MNPSVRSFRSTLCSRAGLSRALRKSDFCASSMTIFSVPAEMTERLLAISTCPGRTTGSGNRTTPKLPSRALCETCNNGLPPAGEKDDDSGEPDRASRCHCILHR